MLINDYKLRIVLPECNPSSQKVNAIADLSENISEVFPYLNTVLKGFQFSEKGKILTVKRGGHLITFRPREIAITNLEDENEARAVLEELKQILNETYINKDRIKPSYIPVPVLKPLDILKLLPGTNCKKCGVLTCFAFAFKLTRQEIEMTKCTPLFSGEYQEKRKVLLELLHAC